MKWLDKIKNLKYLFKSIDDLNKMFEDLKTTSVEINQLREDFINIRNEECTTEEEKNANNQNLKECVKVLDEKCKKYDILYPAINYLLKENIKETKISFMKDVFYIDREITLNELANIISGLEMKCRAFPENQSVVVYLDPNEDFPEYIMIVIGIEGMWLKIQGYPLRCNIKNKTQREAFLDDINKYNYGNRYFKVHLDEDDQPSIERQDFIDSYRTSSDLSDKLGFAIKICYDFFKDRKDFFTEVIEFNKSTEKLK